MEYVAQHPAAKWIAREAVAEGRRREVGIAGGRSTLMTGARTRPMGETEGRTSYVKRGIGLLFGCSPLLLLVASLAYGLAGHSQLRPLSLVAELIALLVGALNFYLSFLRRVLHRWRTGTLDGYRYVSGFPMVGNVLAILGVFLGFGSIVSAVIGLVAVAVDTGGSAWFVISTWRDASL